MRVRLHDESRLRDICVILMSAGLGDYAVVHGSAASGTISYVRTDVGQVLISDVDILVKVPLSDAEKAELSREIAPGFASSAGELAPSARVSVKAIGPMFRRTAESASLLWSARVHGVSARDVVRGRHASRTLDVGMVRYPFGLQYAELRWLMLAGQDPLGNLAALYELAKACGRFVGTPLVKDTRCSVSHTERSLRTFLLSTLPAVRRHLAGRAFDAIRSWAETPCDVKRGLDAETKRACVEGLRATVVRRWPVSVLRERLDACAEEIAHASN